MLPLKKRSSFVVAALLFTMTMGMLLNQVVGDDPAPLSEIVSAATPPPFAAQMTTESLDSAQIRDRIAQIELLLEQQPSHFDLLINAALLYRADGHEEKANQYWENARRINPNDQIFKL